MCGIEINNKYKRLTLLSPEGTNSFHAKNTFVLTNHNQGYMSKDKIKKKREYSVLETF